MRPSLEQRRQESHQRGVCMGTWYKWMCVQGRAVAHPSWTIKRYVYMYDFMGRLSFCKGIKIKDLSYFLTAYDGEKRYGKKSPLTPREEI